MTQPDDPTMTVPPSAITAEPAPAPRPPANAKAMNVWALVFGAVVLLASLGAAGASIASLCASVEGRQKNDQTQGRVVHLDERIGHLDERVDHLANGVDQLTKRLDAAAREDAAKTKADPPKGPDKTYYAFRRVAILPVVPPEGASDFLKGEVSRLEKSLPVLMKKHSDLELIPPEEVARLKIDDPVQAGRDLKAEAVVLVRFEWDPYNPTTGGKPEYAPKAVVEIYEVETSFRVLRTGDLIGRWQPDRSAVHEEWRDDMAREAKKIVEHIQVAAAGRK
jgi:hypothetical protein